MKKRKLVSALLVSVMFLAQGSVFAQGRHDDNSRCGPGDRGCASGPSRDRNDDRRDSRKDRRGPPERQGHAYNERGAGPNHNFYRGQRLPPQYVGRQYVVDDWRGHGLRSPPRGYHWVQTGGDYVLVAVATGIILELLLNR